MSLVSKPRHSPGLTTILVLIDHINVSEVVRNNEAPAGVYLKRTLDTEEARGLPQI